MLRAFLTKSEPHSSPLREVVLTVHTKGRAKRLGQGLRYAALRLAAAPLHPSNSLGIQPSGSSRRSVGHSGKLPPPKTSLQRALGRHFQYGLFVKSCSNCGIGKVSITWTCRLTAAFSSFPIFVWNITFPHRSDNAMSRRRWRCPSSSIRQADGTFGASQLSSAWSCWPGKSTWPTRDAVLNSARLNSSQRSSILASDNGKRGSRRRSGESCSARLNGRHSLLNETSPG
ncbi:hypothetical protein Pan54_23900 [Rubinisphaera italica]|uniref:Uncharacterized protein n=1 Tax=Rubinisphaera italica TaxID=2527969 RepID=A0A5C5XH79_9PLAN|nr:hypothetical protein Pan54_23900 [Rubinisphaera italica]